MPKPTKGPRLGGTPTHQRIILANLASQLFEHGRITTTEAKAKRVRPLAEQLITKAKRGDLHNRRQVLRTITDKSVVHVLFTEIAPTFEDREGGYLRITKVGNRKGDNAPMAVIELVTETVEEGRKNRGVEVAPKKKSAKSDDKKSDDKKSDDKKSDGKKSDAKKSDEDEADEAVADADEAAEDSDADDSDADDSADESEAGDPAGDDTASDDTASDDTEGASKYGEGSYVGDEPPSGYDIKGNADSMKFHTPSSPWYDRTIAEVWFNSEDAAEKAGFVNAVSDDDDEADSEDSDSKE